MNSLYSVLKYEASTGNLYVCSAGKQRRLFPNESGMIDTTIQGKKLKSKLNKIIWELVHNKEVPIDHVVFHKNMQENDYRLSNLQLLPKKTYNTIMEAMKNLSGALRIIPHPTDAFSYILEFKDKGRQKREVLYDISVARKKLLKMQLRYIKIVGRYVITG